MSQQRETIHESHVIRPSDASTYDVVCINCNETDQVPGGLGELVNPCPKPVGDGGITLEEWEEKRRSPVTSD